MCLGFKSSTRKIKNSFLSLFKPKAGPTSRTPAPAGETLALSVRIETDKQLSSGGSMQIEIKKLEGRNINEFISLIRLFEDVFEMKYFLMPDNKHLLNILKREDFIVFVAVKENQIIGGLTAYILEQYYSKKPLAYIYDIAVLTKYQKQGIGKKLIKEMTKYCTELDYEEVFVQVDKADDYAIEFYRKTQITNEEEVVHFNYLLDKK